jgi:hypothetical protein
VGCYGVYDADELEDVEKWHSVAPNDCNLDRVYLHEPSSSYPFGIWVDSFSGIERFCWRCGDRTLTWIVYSHMDHTYLRLCHVDLYEYSNAGFIKPRKNGSIATKGNEFTITSCPTKFAKKDKEIFGA